MPFRAVGIDRSFAHHWQVEVLERPPLIAPSRQYVYPQAVEEVERGALLVLLRARQGMPPVMATFALGFEDPSLPSGVWSCPNPTHLCAVAGGYAYIVEADRPDRWQQVPYRPVVSIHPAPAESLLVFGSFHKLWALSTDGMAWETGRLSWEGLRVTEIRDGSLYGFGWDVHTDAEVPFTVHLATGRHTGGVD